MDAVLVESIVDQVMRRLMEPSPVGGMLTGGTASTAPASTSDLITPDILAGRVVIGVSARHIHLTDDHVEQLFGPGAKLTSFRPLLQPGEFASEQQVTLVGPAGRCFGPVRVLGPTRKASQVELSLTDCIQLGLKTLPPVRRSGDHKESFGITMVGPAGAVTLKNGLIRANRHIHLHTSQAAAMGVKDNDYVHVRINGDRPTLFLDVNIRTNDAFRAEMHIDTDDANAVGVKTGAMAEIVRNL